MYFIATVTSFDVTQCICTVGSAENQRQFDEAMKHGHISAWLCKLLMYGAAGSGKTCTKELVVGNPPPNLRSSTPLATRPTTMYRVNLEGEGWSTIRTLKERKALLARFLVNINDHLVDDWLVTQSDTKSTKAVSTAVQPVIRANDKTSSDPSKPNELVDTQPTLALEEQSVSGLLDSVSSDEASDSDSDVDAVLQSVATDQDLIKLMGELSTTVGPVATFRMLQIIDSGGQPQFHEVLPIFLQRLAFYVFVFRLCDDLTSRPEVEYYVNGKSVGTPITSAQTIEQLLQHCFRAMHSYRASSSCEGECPQILIVGTHVDQEKKSKESREAKNKKILKLIKPILEKQVIYHNIPNKEVIFPINAVKPGRQEQDIIEQIRKVLSGESSIPAMDIPLKWFALEILLEEMSQALQQGVLSRKECFSTAIEKLHFEEDAAEFDAAIHHLNDLSVIQYYPDILPEVIFADPQVLLDKVTELVFTSFRMSVASSTVALNDEWCKFYEFALVTAKFLSQEDFSKHYVPGLFQTKDLITLFKKLLIFAHFNDTQLFVPALLRDLGKEEVSKHRVSNLPSLVLEFPNGGPRKGIFCSLLCWLVSPDNDTSGALSISTDEVGTPACLHRNCVQLDVPMSPATVTLIDTYTHFEVHVDIPIKHAHDLCPKIFPKIRKAIFRGVNKATLNLGYDNSTPRLALLCPCCKEEAHVAAVNREIGYWTCSVNKKECGELTQYQLLWLEDHSATSSIISPKRLTDYQLSTIYSVLKTNSSIWMEIGMHLGFKYGELCKIAARPLLHASAPESCLLAMLSEWLQWAPGDNRGSTSFASSEMLKSALNKSGLGATAHDLSYQLQV